MNLLFSLFSRRFHPFDVAEARGAATRGSVCLDATPTSRAVACAARPGDAFGAELYRLSEFDRSTTTCGNRFYRSRADYSGAFQRKLPEQLNFVQRCADAGCQYVVDSLRGKPLIRGCY